MGQHPKLSFIQNHGEEVIAGFALVIVACCVFLQVIFRFVFNSALSWTEELAGFSMVWAVLMGASYAIRERFHIRITIIRFLLPFRIVLIIFIFGDFLWFLFTVFMIFQGWEYLSVLWDRTYISPSLGIEQKWPQSVVILAFILMAFRIIEVYYYWIKNGCKGFPGIKENEDIDLELDENLDNYGDKK